jgi:toxin ParE1/3/4
MTRQIIFRASARRDIANLAEQSEARWGKRQTRRYLDALEGTIQKLTDNPMLGHDAGLPRPGLRRMNSGRHAVFYLVTDERIEIVRVLHVASDFVRWV